MNALLHSHIDSAVISESSHQRYITLIGWFLHERKSWSQLTVHIGTKMFSCSPKERPDIKARVPLVQHSKNTGFELTFPIPEEYQGKITLAAVIQLEDGELCKTFLSTTPQIKSVQISETLSEEIHKQSYLHIANIKYESFLAGKETLSIPSNTIPLVSVIIVTFNQAALTFHCLSNLIIENKIPMECILVDNASTDTTRTLLSRCTGIQTILNDENKHFLSAANQGAKIAKGKYLLIHR